MLRNLIFVLAICFGSCLGAQAVSAAEAGKIVFVTGSAYIGTKVATLDAAVEEGDELSTGADGYIYLKTIDSGFLILRSKSKARITRYHVDTNTPANTRIKLELIDGVARSISGQAVKKARENFRFNTPVAAIGVRGTDFIVYATQELTRVAVVSGGVIVSSYSGACGPEGGGPCEGGGSRELFEGQPNAVLQIQRGQAMPQLLQGSSLLPDRNAAPRSDEPVGKVVSVVSTSTELNLDALKSANVVSRPGAVPSLPDGDLVKPVLPNPVAPPGLALQAAPTVMWGRYQALAGIEPDAALKTELNSDKYTGTTALGSYIIKRLSSYDFVMPREGTASFVLQGGEAFLSKGGHTEAAKVERGSLNVDFARSAFSTKLSLAGAQFRMDVSGHGDVTLKGELVNALASPSVISGYLGGAKVDEAAYIFTSKSADNSMSAEGAVRFKR